MMIRHLLYILVAMAQCLLMTVSALASEALVKEKQCATCHRFSPDADVNQRKGPDLFFAGSKFQKPWLLEYLQHPTVLRKTGFTMDPGFLKGQPKIAQPHPSLSESEAEEVTDFLMEQVDARVPQGKVNTEPLSKGKRIKAKMLFEREYGCIACHQSFNLAHKPRGGISGPSLIDAGNRLQADWVFHWLKEPRSFEPKGRMPVFELSDEEREMLTRYIMWHKKEYLR